MVNFIYQLDWAPGFPDSWLNIVLGNSVSMSLKGLSFNQCTKERRLYSLVCTVFIQTIQKMRENSSFLVSFKWRHWVLFLLPLNLNWNVFFLDLRLGGFPFETPINLTSFSLQSSSAIFVLMLLSIVDIRT